MTNATKSSAYAAGESVTALTDALDWSTTPVGPRSGWPQSLRTALGICLKSRFPIIIFWGPQLVQLYNDAYAEQILQSRHPSALGRPAAETWHDIWDSIGPMLHGVLETGTATWSENLLLPMKRDGRLDERFFTFSYSPLEEADGNVGVFCAVTETTAAVLRERDASERIAALAELDRAKTEFFHNISHEFRTPLTLMLGPLDAILTDKQTSESVHGDILLVKRNANRLLRLVNTLLEFSRIDASKRTIDPVAVSIAAFTAELVGTFESAYIAAGLSLRFASANFTSPVMIDVGLYEHLVMNILSNALKFTFVGGVSVALDLIDDRIRLSVSDTGIGMSEEDVASAFQRFHRGRATRSRSFEGSGIGLALVREIAELHAGTASLRSVVDVGTTVTVEFPLVAATQSVGISQPAGVASGYVTDIQTWTDAPTLTQSSKREDRPTILIIDDNADMRHYLERLLGERYNVVTAPDGASGIATALELRPNLVLSDVMMPTIDGFTVVRRLRESPITQLTPVLLLTARADDAASNDAVLAGADGYITKPFHAANLLARIDRELLQGRARAKELARFREIADHLPHIVFTHNVFGSVDWANKRWYEFSGLAPDIALEPSGWRMVIPEIDMPAILATIADAVGKQIGYRLETRFKPVGSSDEAFRWHTVVAEPMFNQRGILSGWAGTATDVDDEMQSRRRLIRSEAAFRALAETIPHIVFTTRIDGSHDYFNPRWFEYTGLTSADSAEKFWTTVLHPDDLERTRTAWHSALETGADFSVEYRLRGATGGYRWFVGRALPQLGDEGQIVRWFGTCTDIDEQRRLALETERLYEREHRASQAFQDAALPKCLPTIPGLSFSAVYQAAEAGAAVGGDWYDAFRLGDGRLVLSVGDVNGSGLDASVTMAAVRQAIRGAVQIYPDPVAVLDAADRALRSEQPDRIVTAFVGILDPITLDLTYASAGHPPPLLLDQTGEFTDLNARGLPLGLRSVADVASDSSVTTVLPEHALLVLYTDGLTEATRDIFDGDRRLRAAMRARYSCKDTGAAASAIRDAVIANPSDDVAILAVWIHDLRSAISYGGPLDVHGGRWSFVATDGQHASSVRRELARALGSCGASDPEIANAELLFSELVGNVLRHTTSPVELALDLSGDEPVMHVLDRGQGFTFHARLPKDVMAESGRGLYIASKLARDVSIVPRRDGGSHARVVLPMARPLRRG